MQITPHLVIPDFEFRWTYVRSSGPGGQNVNKVASKAVLHWPVRDTTSLPAEVRTRFLQQQSSRINMEGELYLASQRFRDQERNREDCLEKLRQLVLLAMNPPRKRRATKPTRGSKEARLRAKQRRSQTKSSRRRPPLD